MFSGEDVIFAILVLGIPVAAGRLLYQLYPAWLSNKEENSEHGT